VKPSSPLQPHKTTTMPTYSTTLDIEVQVIISEDIVLTTDVPVECYLWTNEEIDPEKYDEEFYCRVEKSYVEPEWFHVRFRDIAIQMAEEQFLRDKDKYEQD